MFSEYPGKNPFKKTTSRLRDSTVFLAIPCPANCQTRKA